MLNGNVIIIHLVVTLIEKIVIHKSDLRDAAGVDTSPFAKKRYS